MRGRDAGIAIEREKTAWGRWRGRDAGGTGGDGGVDSGGDGGKLGHSELVL